MTGPGAYKEGQIKRLGQILIERGWIIQEQLDEALKEAEATHTPIGQVIVKKGWITNDELQRALALQGGVSVFDLSKYIVDPAVIKLIPESFARKYKLLPVFVVENDLTVAMVDPSNLYVIDEIQRMTKMQVNPVLADEIEVHKSQDQYYGGAGNLNDLIASIDRTKLLDAEKLGEEAPVIKIVNYVIVQAIQKNASDIHVEPEEKFLNIRYRIDGLLHKQFSLPLDLTPAVISRLKIMGSLDIAEKRLPQDGHIVMKVGNKNIDFRMSTCPTIHGENIVLRVLDKNEGLMGMAALGFEDREMRLFNEILKAPYGILLVTGPTGSGKTTTLYSALQTINKEDVNIMTVEDPVEYHFMGIRQVNVNTVAGLTFAAALRSFLRQDPDVIMVGEIRDRETAEIATQAALTGHLVLSTLHTNDSPSAFTRLVDMGVEPFLVSSSMLGVLAQRLVRRVCEKCKQPFEPLPELLKDLGLDAYIGKGIKFNKGRGCDYCGNSGYKGRIGIYEILRMSPAIQELVLKRASADDIRAVAVKEGLVTLRQAVLSKLLAGLTTPEEVFRVTME